MRRTVASVVSDDRCGAKELFNSQHYSTDVYFSFGGTVVVFERDVLSCIFALVRACTSTPDKQGRYPPLRGRFSTQADFEFGQLLTTKFFDLQLQLLKAPNKVTYQHSPQLCSFVPIIGGHSSNRLYTSIQGVRVTYLFKLGLKDRSPFSSLTAEDEPKKFTEFCRESKSFQVFNFDIDYQSCVRKFKNIFAENTHRVIQENVDYVALPQIKSSRQTYSLQQFVVRNTLTEEEVDPSKVNMAPAKRATVDLEDSDPWLRDPTPTRAAPVSHTGFVSLPDDVDTLLPSFQDECYDILEECNDYIGYLHYLRDLQSIDESTCLERVAAAGLSFSKCIEEMFTLNARQLSDNDGFEAIDLITDEFQELVPVMDAIQKFSYISDRHIFDDVMRVVFEFGVEPEELPSDIQRVEIRASGGIDVYGKDYTEECEHLPPGIPQAVSDGSTVVVDPQLPEQVAQPHPEAVLRDARNCCRDKLQEALHELVAVEKQLEQLKAQLAALACFKERGWLKEEFIEPHRNEMKDVESRILVCVANRQTLADEIRYLGGC